MKLSAEGATATAGPADLVEANVPIHVLSDVAINFRPFGAFLIRRITDEL
jgi:hypothetical protein